MRPLDEETERLADSLDRAMAGNPGLRGHRIAYAAAAFVDARIDRAIKLALFGTVDDAAIAKMNADFQIDTAKTNARLDTVLARLSTKEEGSP